MVKTSILVDVEGVAVQSTEPIDGGIRLRWKLPPDVLAEGGRWQAFRHVTLPLLGPTLRVSVFLSMIGALQLFDMVWVTTKGGPLDASDTMAVLMYQTGIPNSQVGLGSAMAVILFILGLVLALAYQRYVLSRDVEGGTTAFNG